MGGRNYEQEDEDYYKPVMVKKFYSNNSITYENSIK